MKNIIIGIVIVGALAGAYYWNKGRTPETEQQTQTGTYQDATVPLSFEYPAGYVIQELVPTTPIANLAKVVALILEADYQSLMSGEREGGEAPPAIVFQVFENPSALSAAEWIEQNPQIANTPLIQGEMEEVTVAGQPGVSYRADGLYPNRNVVFAAGTYIYYINGSYLDQESPLYRDFEGIVESVEVSQ